MLQSRGWGPNPSPKGHVKNCVGFRAGACYGLTLCEEQFIHIIYSTYAISGQLDSAMCVCVCACVRALQPVPSCAFFIYLTHTCTIHIFELIYECIHDVCMYVRVHACVSMYLLVHACVVTSPSLLRHLLMSSPANIHSKGGMPDCTYCIHLFLISSPANLCSKGGMPD